MDRGGLHPVDAFLDLVLEHGTALRWRTTISNHRPEVLKKLAREPGIQMGFSDAGAHLRNMAFYNMGLRLLRHVRDAEKAGKPFMTVEQAVHRLTGELADWYRLDAGHLRIGDRADLVVIDPERLDDDARELRRGPGRAVRRPVPHGQPQRRHRHRRVRRRPCGFPRRQAHRDRRQAAHRALPPCRAPGPGHRRPTDAEFASVS